MLKCGECCAVYILELKVAERIFVAVDVLHICLSRDHGWRLNRDFEKKEKNEKAVKIGSDLKGIEYRAMKFRCEVYPENVEWVSDALLGLSEAS